MRRTIFIIAFLAVIAFRPALAKVTEEMSMEKAVSHAGPESLLIFDIDNTLIQPVQMLGSDQWFFYMVDKFVKDGASQEDATEKAWKAWVDVQKVTKVRPAEATTPKLISDAQGKGIFTMALTARSYDEGELTHRQLSSVGIDMTGFPPLFKDLELTEEGMKRPARYYKGVLLVDLNDKGEVLDMFLKMMKRKSKFSPANVVFIDDKMKNVSAVDAALAKVGLECDCIRYGYLDAQVKKFDPKVADIEYKNMGATIMDDAAARAVLSSKSSKK